MSILIGSARIAVIPDISGFGADLKSKVQAEARAAGGNISIPVQFNVDAASVAKVKAALGAFGGATVPVKFDVDPASAAAARAALGPLGGETVPVEFAVDEASAAKARAALGLLGGETAQVEVGVDPASLAKANAEIRAGLTSETVPVEVGVDPASLGKANTEIRAGLTGDTVPINTTADLGSVAQADAAIKAAVDASFPGSRISLKYDVDTGSLTGFTIATAAAAKTADGLTTATAGTGNAALLAGTRFGFLGGTLPLFTAASGATIGVFHVLADAVIEFGAVAVPAFGAAALGLGAFALVAARAGDTAGLVADHLRALNTVATATGTNLPFLTHNFNDLTTAIRPQVWGLYGDAIDVVNSKFGSIGSLATKTGGVLDTIGARIVVDMNSAGTGLTTFLAAGQRDLAMFGGILMTLGNAFSNLIKAAEVTHIAEDLLAVVGAAATLLDWITKLPAPLLEAGLAMHALYMWGGLAVTAISNLAAPLIALGGRLATAVTMTGSLGDRLITAVGPASLLGKALGFIGSNPWAVAITVGVVAITAFAIWMSKATDATDQWVAASQKAVQNASIYSLVNTEAAQLVATNQHLADATNNLSGVQGANFLGMVSGSHDVAALTGNHAQLNQELTSTITHADNVASTFGTSLPGAYALAAFAGVKVSDMTTTQNKTWDTAMQKIQGVVTGYANMGQGLGQLGSDVSAVSYAASDQLKAITNLNNAYDTFTKNLAAPVSTFTSFAGDIIKFGNDAQTAGAQAGGLGSGIQNMAKSINPASLQLQSDFQSSYSSAEKLFDAMRTSQAPAAQQIKSIKDTVASLIPLAGTSQVAAAQISSLAQEAGGPATTNLQTLQKWAGVTATQGMTGLQTDTNNAAVAMSNLSQDAHNLAGALQQDLTADMAKAVEGAVGIQGAMDNFTKSVHDNGAAIANASPAYTTLYNDLIALGESPTQAISQISALSGTFKTTGGAADTLGTPHLANLQQAMGNTSGTTGTLGYEVGTTLPANMQTAGQKMDTLGSPHAANLQQAMLDTTGRTAGFGFEVGTTMPGNLATGGKAMDNMGSPHASNLQQAMLDTTGKTSGFGFEIGTNMPANISKGNTAMDTSKNGSIAGLTGAINNLTTTLGTMSGDFATQWPSKESTNVTVTASGGVKVSGGGTTDQVVLSNLGLAAGGVLPGFSGPDSIHALLAPGEGILTSSAVRMIGPESVHALNSAAKHFASGGVADGITTSGMGVIPDVYPTAYKGMQNATGAIDAAFSKVLDTTLSGVVAKVKAAQAAAAAAAGGYNAVPAQSGSAKAAQDFASAHLAQFGWGQDQMAPLIALWNQECITIDAVILTRRGWLSHDEVRAGDQTIGYNSETGRSEWTRITRVVYYEDAEVVRLGNKQWHANVTPGHRWWSDARENQGRGHIRERSGFIRTCDLTWQDRLRLAAPADTDGIPGFSLEDVAVLAWLQGDGHIKPITERALAVCPDCGWVPSSVARAHSSVGLHRRRSHGIRKSTEISGYDGRIYQSKPEQIVRLRAALARIEHTESVVTPRDRGRDEQPEHVFLLRRAYVTDLVKRSEIEETGPEAFVLRLSPDQRTAWLAAIIDAEGSQRDNHTVIYQNAGPLCDAIVLAAYLEGFHPVVHPFGSARQIGLCAPHITAKRLQSKPTGRQPVFCLTTELGSWTAQQDGQVFLTGNSGWNANIVNKSSGAMGIPQALGHGNVFALGDYANQVLWGLNYIKGRYGSPAAAEAHEQANNWYGQGGVIPEPVVGVGLRSGDRYHFGENGPETVTPGVGGGKGVNINYYGPQRPSPEQEQAILMKASAMIGVS